MSPILQAAPSIRPSRALAAAVLLLALAACGRDSESPMQPPPGASIAVSPAITTVLVHSQQQFIAQVSNLPSDSVVWSLEPARLDAVPESLGTITPSGLYTSPTRIRAGFDYQVRVVATSASDPSVRGTANLIVPRVIVRLIPSSLGSVPPGSAVPYTVEVENAPMPGFELFVEGVAGGDTTVGTWTQTGPNTAVYVAPRSCNDTRALSLLARSLEDPQRFNSALVTVRRGYPLAVDSNKSQFSPEWNPTSSQVAYAEGPPWTIVSHDVSSGSQVTLASFEWSGASYDGRIAWSPDGGRVAFSEEVAGRRAIGLVHADGSGRATFAPNAAGSSWHAAFWPVSAGEPDSLVVALVAGGLPSLRVFAAADDAGAPGRIVVAAAAGARLEWPDAIRLSGLPVVAYEHVSSGVGVLRVIEDGSTPVSIASGPGRRSQVRWARQGVTPWVLFVWSVDGVSYRLRRSGSETPIKLYSEFFPQQGGDLSTASEDDHVVARLEPDGRTHPWVVEFPPIPFLGTSRAEREELAAMGIHGALQPSSWSRWLGPGGWSTLRHGGRR